MFDEMSLLLSVCFDKYICYLCLNACYLCLNACYLCLIRLNYVKILFSFLRTVQIKIGKHKLCCCCDFLICIISYFFIMPVIFNVSYPQISLICVPFVEYIILSTNIMTPYSLSLFLAHEREKISFGVA